MPNPLFGTGSVSSMLRGGLEETSATHRAIAQRVANALQVSTSADFGQELAKRIDKGQQIQEDLERDMASLADTQLRYEADAKLLQGTYASFRAAMKMNG